MAVLGAALVIYVLRAQAGSADAATWGVLAAAAVLGASVLIGAARAATAEGRQLAGRYTSLLHTVARGRSEVQAMAVALERGERVEQPLFAQHAPNEISSYSRLASEISLAQFEVRAAFAHAVQLIQGSDPGTEERVEVFVNLARRLQSLAHRQLSRLEALENEVEDPELLNGLFHVDHMATRIRRHAENVAVLGGSVSRRQWTRPVTLMEVLRSSISEVEHYSRVKLVPPIEGSLRGHAVADVIHLLAELLENATSFSDPSTQVLLRAQRVTAGLAVEVEDRGLGISPEEQARLNSLLTQPDRIDLSKLLVDGRIGLYVVSELARRHGIAVRLQSNIFGGIQAVLVLPHGLVGDESTEVPLQAAVEAARPLPSAAPQPPALQAGPDAGYVPPSLDTAEPMPQRRPMPQGQPVAASAPRSEQQTQQRPMPQGQPVAASAPRSEQQTQRRAMPQGQPVAASAPRSEQQTQRQAGPVQRPAAHDPGPYERDSRIGRPPLPQRQAQEHLAPQLRDAPTARMTGGMPEEEHDPGLMAAFQRGFSLADEAPADGPAEDPR
ncbi:ATP-binding protein [Streptomyces sp. NPDC005917]|uniref:ATP-binding protein n=1 Tax=unclassified Streptomyces TaxID=2593676 RepID=UPI0033E0E491